MAGFNELELMEFAEEWTRVCKLVKDTGKDLSTIRLTKEIVEE